MMDQLDDNTISRLQAMTCKGTRSLLPGALDVLFFDCTTLYFESLTFTRNRYDCLLGGNDHSLTNKRLTRFTKSAGFFNAVPSASAA